MNAALVIVGVAGFEPTTSSSQTRRDTGLRYTPRFNIQSHFYFKELLRREGDYLYTQTLRHSPREALLSNPKVLIPKITCCAFGDLSFSELS